MKILFKSDIKKSLPVVKAGFNRDLFLALSPPFPPFELVRFDGCLTGHEVHILLKTPGLLQKWVSLITDHQDSETEWFFIDEGRILPWPLSFWKHKHRVIKISDTESQIIDDIEFKTSPFWLAPFIYPALWLSFAIRPGRYRKFFGA
jgi:ligand-binding SRPBCC domain-containing protein